MINYRECFNDVYEVVSRNFSGAKIEQAMISNLEKWQANKEHLYNLLGGKMIYKSDTFLGTATDEVISEAYDNFLQQLDEWANNSDYETRDNIITLMRVTRFNVCKEGFLNNKFTYNYASQDFYDLPKPKNAFYVEEGSKYSKSMKFFIKDKDILRRIQDLYSTYTQKLSTNKKMMNVYLSIHPLDYLTVSENRYGWRSCHAISDGDYRAGNFNYMVDNTTLVAYVMEDKEEDLFNDTYWPIGEVRWNSKIWRCLIHIDEKGMFLNKQYPYTSDVFLDQTEVVLDELTNHLFDKKVVANRSERVAWENTDYPMFFSDLDNNDRGVYAKELKDKEAYRMPNGNLGYVTVRIGEDAYCLDCGTLGASDTYSCTCNQCSGTSECCCDICGSYWPSDSMYYIHDENVCPNCRDDNYFECGSCHELFHNDYGHYSNLFGSTLCDQCYTSITSSLEPFNILYLSNQSTINTDTNMKIISNSRDHIDKIFNGYTYLSNDDKFLAISEYYDIYVSINGIIGRSIPYSTHTHWHFNEILSILEKERTKEMFNNYFNEQNLGPRKVFKIYGIASREEMLFFKELLENTEMKPTVILDEGQFVELQPM